jgi:hypothetical protein
MIMSDLASILKTASKNLDKFPLDKQKEILSLVEELGKVQTKEKPEQSFFRLLMKCGRALYMENTMR